MTKAELQAKLKELEDARPEIAREFSVARERLVLLDNRIVKIRNEIAAIDNPKPEPVYAVPTKEDAEAAVSAAKAATEQEKE